MLFVMSEKKYAEKKSNRAYWKLYWDKYKCLVIEGARQVGKTYAVELFAKDRFEELVEINFKDMPSAGMVFSEDLTVDDMVRIFSLFFEWGKLAQAEQKNNYYKEYLSTMTETDCLPGAKELIATLKAKGILVAIGSSSKNTVAILGKIGLLDSFDAIADGTQITHSMPDPEVFLLAARQLGLKSEECIVVEDAYMGIEALVVGYFIPVAIGRDAASHKGAQYRIEALSQNK